MTLNYQELNKGPDSGLVLIFMTVGYECSMSVVESEVWKNVILERLKLERSILGWKQSFGTGNKKIFEVSWNIKRIWKYILVVGKTHRSWKGRNDVGTKYKMGGRNKWPTIAVLTNFQRFLPSQSKLSNYAIFPIHFPDTWALHSNILRGLP